MPELRQVVPGLPQEKKMSSNLIIRLKNGLIAVLSNGSGVTGKSHMVSIDTGLGGFIWPITSSCKHFVFC